MDPNWRPALATALKSPQVPAAPAATLLQRLGQRTPLQPGEVDAYVTLLSRLGRNAEARQAWWQSQPFAARGSDDASGLFDGGFEQPDVVGGFGWRIATQPGLTIVYDDIDPLEGARSLLLDFDGRAVAGPRRRTIAGPAPRPLPPGVRCGKHDRRGASLPARSRLPGCPGSAAFAGTPGRDAHARVAAQRGRIRRARHLPGQVLRLRYPARSLQERMVSGALRLDAMRLNRLEN
jgi:hypothetical protein